MANKKTYSQIGQDVFVLNVLNDKRNGFYLELGAHAPIFINNTYLMSKEYNWKGISIDYQSINKKPWAKERPNDILVIADATKINYLDLLRKYNAPRNIDYLQIDLDTGTTLEALEKIDKEVMDYYKFAVVTFEHDCYGKKDSNIFTHTRNKSREIFKRRGYMLVFPNVQKFEDWYVHPSLVNMDYINQLLYHNRHQKPSMTDRHTIKYP